MPYLFDLFDEFSRRIPGIRLGIVGPLGDTSLEPMIRAAAERHPVTFEYRGEIAGAERERFYRDINLSVLPATLVDEAEPLGMFESYAHGVDVFATATGCIPSRIRDRWLVLSLNLVENALRIAAVACDAPDGWDRRRRMCHDHAAGFSESNQQQRSALLGALCGDGADALPDGLGPATMTMEIETP